MRRNSSQYSSFNTTSHFLVLSAVNTMNSEFTLGTPGRLHFTSLTKLGKTEIPCTYILFKKKRMGIRCIVCRQKCLIEFMARVEFEIQKTKPNQTNESAQKGSSSLSHS